MEYKYKPGDKVRVRPDLHESGSYKMVSGTRWGFSPGVNSAMCSYAGKITTVSHCYITYVQKDSVFGHGAMKCLNQLSRFVANHCCEVIV